MELRPLQEAGRDTTATGGTGALMPGQLELRVQCKDRAGIRRVTNCEGLELSSAAVRAGKNRNVSLIPPVARS